MTLQVFTMSLRLEALENCSRCPYGYQIVNNVKPEDVKIIAVVEGVLVHRMSPKPTLGGFYLNAPDIAIPIPPPAARRRLRRDWESPSRPARTPTLSAGAAAIPAYHPPFGGSDRSGKVGDRRCKDAKKTSKLLNGRSMLFRETLENILYKT